MPNLAALLATVALTTALPLVASSPQDLEYQRAPGQLGPHAPRVGEQIPEVELELVGVGSTSLASLLGPRGLVVFLRDPDCPLSKRYSPRVGELESELVERGFGVLLLGSDAELAERDIAEHGLTAPYAVDPAQRLAAALEASTTTEVFVLDRARTLVYRGMLDDQYGLGFARPEPKREYLLEALAAVAANEAIAVPATMAQGCLLELDDAEAPPRPAVTYHNRISRIVQDHCQVCHREGSSGPFPLASYADLKKRRSMLRWAVQDGVMPPWFAEHGSGPWANDRSLSESEREDLLGWLAGGVPEGDAADAPVPRTWTPGWTIGEPDLVVALPEAIRVPAQGRVEYEYAYVQLDLPEDRWVEAVEVRPGAPEVVHHVLVFLEDPSVRDAARRGDRAANRRQQNGFDGYFVGTVPGQIGTVFPKGTGKRLPKDAWLKFQLHYTPNGVEQLDRTEIGFVFADGPLAEVHTDSANNRDFRIPPKAFDFEVQAEFEFEEDAALLSLLPHTHLRGMRFKYELLLPGAEGGEPESLLSLPYYDFNWQLNYDLAEPRRVPAGTVLRARAWFDNSVDNPSNPDPSAWVEFGEQTEDEMMIGYVNWVPAAALASD